MRTTSWLIWWAACCFALNLSCGSSDTATESSRSPAPDSGTDSDRDLDVKKRDRKKKTEEDAKQPGEDTKPDDKAPPTDETPKQRERCQIEVANMPSSYTIASVTELINRLPRPATIPCLIDVLPRPLKVNATFSELSVQPAVGPDNPRIFIVLDSLILTFALAGDGSKAIEFGELTSDGTSVKGEIAFPVTSALAATAAYDQIMRMEGGGTRCAGCHFDEKQAPGYPETAHLSRALRPFARQDVPLSDLKSLRFGCKDEAALKCQVLESLYTGGDPVPYVFPSSMPTLF